MWLSNLMSSVTRAVAIESLGLLARIPGMAAALPEGRLRRLLATAAIPDLKYEGIYSQSAYAPWLADVDFRTALNAIRRNTLVDEYRCWELWSLVGQLRDHEGDILEVGVWRGGTGCLMARRSQLDGNGGKVHLCDTFEGVVKAGSRDSSYVGGEHADTSLEEVQSLARRMELPNVLVHKGMFPDDTAHEIGSNRLRLCHIDVDVYESASQTFAWAWPRLVVGGVIVLDDYGFYSCSGVTRFVNQMIGQSDRVVIYNISGHAIVVKLAD
ncbi:TylF/MycF/NovP-related O-methyltransferase [Reyranella sp.]|uniref:TylF/MycF/NovP-related O-methyltransferase n=1 Tax=Reyranella sp. TaxID=1929291 RepID=UPI003BACBFE4